MATPHFKDTGMEKLYRHFLANPPSLASGGSVAAEFFRKGFEGVSPMPCVRGSFAHAAYRAGADHCKEIFKPLDKAVKHNKEKT